MMSHLLPPSDQLLKITQAQRHLVTGIKLSHTLIFTHVLSEEPGWSPGAVVKAACLE